MPHSGKNGKAYFGTRGAIPGGSFTEIPDTRQWSFELDSDNKAYRSSSTGGGTKREAGHSDITGGSIQVYAPDSPDDFPVREGDKVDLKLVESSSKTHYVEAIIDKINPATDIEGGEIVGYTINFSGDGAYTAPS